MDAVAEARAAGARDQLAFGDPVAALHERAGEVRVHRHDSALMPDLDHKPVPLEAPRPRSGRSRGGMLPMQTAYIAGPELDHVAVRVRDIDRARRAEVVLCDLQPAFLQAFDRRGVVLLVDVHGVVDVDAAATPRDPD